MNHNDLRKVGFTIVELLIVIVVIGILAAITIIAFNGITQRSKNATRVDGSTKSLSVLKAYVAVNGLESLKSLYSTQNYYCLGENFVDLDPPNKACFK